MKTILYFYPYIPLENAGNSSRVIKLLDYFKSRNFQVDFVSLETLKHLRNGSSGLEELKNKGYINQIKLIKRTKRSGIKFIIYDIKSKIQSFFSNSVLDFKELRMGQKEEFQAFIQQKDYDYVLFSYANYYELIEGFSGKSKLILDTHDFLTAQFYYKNNADIGKCFSKEMEILNLFHDVWSISIEEKYLFDIFCDNQVWYIPHTHSVNKADSETNKDIDIIWVASDNPYNIQAAEWVVDQILPLLKEGLKIVAIGKICEKLPDHEKLEKMNLVDDLDSFYHRSKIAICPMLSGTGLKIKVVEALAYGLPVVCNEKGMDGLVNKIQNGCLSSNQPKEFVENIHQLLDDSSFYEHHQKEAKQFFESSLSEKAVFKKLDDFFSEV